MIECSAQNSARETVLPPISSSYNKRIDSIFICLLSLQADGAVFDFSSLYCPLQRLHYSTFLCGFVQPRSRNAPHFRLNLPRFRLTRPQTGKKTGTYPCLFRLSRFLYQLAKRMIRIVIAVPVGTGSVST